MAAIPQWHARGDWFDVCSCTLPCPCIFAQAPTNNACEGVLAWHIREGRFGDVVLDGLNVLAVSYFEGNIWSGQTKAVMGVFFDERADGRQRDALQIIFGGQAGGWPAGFADLVGEMRGVEFVPIAFELADDLAHWRAEIPGRVVARAEALSGPTTSPGARVQLHHAPGSETGPGQIATWGQAASLEADAFGFHFEFGNRSSKHIPFDWSGPDASGGSSARP
jgi:hypothetical protein